MPQRPSHPALNVRDDREAPLFIERGTRKQVAVICPTGQAEYFLTEGWTAIRRICPSGKSVIGMLLFEHAFFGKAVPASRRLRSGLFGSVSVCNSIANKCLLGWLR
jgi:hypothetical protein